MITQAILKQLLNYDENTGIFTWKIARRGHVRQGSIAGDLDRYGYFRIGIDGGRYRAHRLVWLYVYGIFPSDQIDHIDGNRANNKLTNLRAVTRAQNGQNRNPQRNISGHRGIVWHKDAKKWQVQAKHKGVCHYAGIFINIEDAVIAAKALRKKLFTHNVEK